MFETSQRVAEGWYPDPDGRLLLRYWNGTEWTLETRGNDSWAATEDHAPARVTRRLPESGWAGIALALHSALLSGQPTTVNVALPTGERFSVETFSHTYSWEGEPTGLPEFQGSATILFSPSEISVEQRGPLLDGLLWRISSAAFPARLAPWLQTDDLYRMQRWPNLTTIHPELDDMRQAAMLANGMFTVDELAGFSDRSITATRSLINALSLMNTLKVATPRDTGVAAAVPVSVEQSSTSLASTSMPASSPAFTGAITTVRSEHKPSLFQRLRSKLGL